MAAQLLATAPAASGRLAPLRSRLDAIRRRRRLSRQLTAWTAVVVGLLAAVLAALAIDRLFSLPVAGRLWLWAGIAAAVVWTFRRHAWPLLRVRESDLDVALSMEKTHGIDSDFVAALQFERPDAGGWGSATLRAAVIDYVAEFGRQWTAAAPLWNRVLAGRAAWVLGLAAVFAAVAAASPATLRAFAGRMLLGSGRYPTLTQIERLVIAGRDIDPANGGAIKAPAGQPLVIEVACGGRRPADGRADFLPEAGGGRAEVPLALAEGQAAGAALSGTLASLTESATVVIHAGDAWSEPVRIEAVAAPVVEATLQVEPPDYARGASMAAASGRQAAVLEGSSVVIEVACLNKDLRSAEVVIEGVGHPLVRHPAGAAGGRDRFVLTGSGSPLAAVTAPVQYEVRAVDVDGLSPDKPLAGAIRIRPDMPPQVTAATVTQAVLPGARPRISYSFKDDYGVAAARARLDVVRGAGTGQSPATETPAAPTAATSVVDILLASARPWVGADLPRSGELVLPLADLGLRKGDFVRVVLEAVDFRGPTAGQAATSPPLDLTVTDESGLLEALKDSESRAAQELQAIIDEQLRVGGNP
jgi:hypothetical protein